MRELQLTSLTGIATETVILQAPVGETILLAAGVNGRRPRRVDRAYQSVVIELDAWRVLYSSGARESAEEADAAAQVWIGEHCAALDREV